MNTKYDLLLFTEGGKRNLVDGFALMWIFTAVLAVGLLMLAINTYTLLFALFSGLLGLIWWRLSHVGNTH